MNKVLMMVVEKKKLLYHRCMPMKTSIAGSVSLAGRVVETWPVQERFVCWQTFQQIIHRFSKIRELSWPKEGW